MTTAETIRSGQSSSSTSGSSTKDELKADADRLESTAKDRASEEADKRKSQATRTARSASDALEKAAGELDSDQNAPAWLSSAFRETAKGIDSFAGEVENRSPEQMGREVSRFARQHPTSFLAASAAAGFAAARFLRAGADYRQHHQGSSSSRGYDSDDIYEAPATGTRPGMTERTGATTQGRFATETSVAQQRYGESQGGTIR